MSVGDKPVELAVGDFEPPTGLGAAQEALTGKRVGSSVMEAP
jgi:hypothetical protein